MTEHTKSAKKGSPWFTPEGTHRLQRLLAELSGRPAEDGPVGPVPRPLPRWDSKSGQFWLGDRFLYEFQKSAPAQTPILDAFQAVDWAVDQVGKPLPREPRESDGDYSKRVENAAKNLNRVMPEGTLHFRPTLGRTGVRWEYTTERKRRPRRRL